MNGIGPFRHQRVMFWGSPAGVLGDHPVMFAESTG